MYRLRTLLFKVALVLWLVVPDLSRVSEAQPVRSAIAQSGSTTLADTTLTANAVVRIGRTIEIAEKEAKVELTEEAKDLIVKQFLLEKTIKGEPLEQITLAPNEARQLAALLSTTKKNALDLPETEALLADWKFKQTTPLISSQVAMNSKLAGVKLDSAVIKTIERDLLQRTKWMARSNIPVENIRKNNVVYLTAIFAAIQKHNVDERAYRKARETVFEKIIRLTIGSTPLQADVEINGTHVGKTVINDKPVEAGLEYVFVFRLKGYKADRRRYYVLPDQPAQEVNGFLLPEK